MQAHHSTVAASLPVDQMIIALQHLDADGKEAVMSIIMTAAKRAYWIRDAIQDAVAQQLQEQRELDAWTERAAAQDLALEAARHADPYANSKAGDAAYWTQ